MSENTFSTNKDLTESHSSSELNAVKRKREVLEKMVKISLTISRLQTGLQSVVLMGKPSSAVPQSAIRLYKSLSVGVQHYPDRKIQESLTAVEDKVSKSIAKVVKIAQACDEISEEETDSEDFDDLNKLLHEFRRRAQTSVALNLLLRNRGVKPRELSFHLPEELINSTIHNLDEREQECKTHIKSKLIEVQHDIDVLLEKDMLPAGMKEEMLTMKNSIAKNLEHLESGKTLEDMPIIIEMIEIGSMEDHSTLFSPTASTDTYKKDASETEHANKHSKKKSGFFAKTKEWMSTSFEIKWKDIE